MKLIKLATHTALTWCALLATAAVAAPDKHPLGSQVPEAAAHLPMLARLRASDRLELAIGLPLRNPAALTNLLGQLYYPGSTNFHRFLTPEQFAEQFGPAERDYQGVIDFARSNRFEILSTFGNRALLSVSATVADIEKAFQVRMGSYQHPTESRRFFAPDTAPSVEAGLAVLFVSGLDNYVIPQPHLHRVPREKHPAPLPMGGSGTGTNNGLYMGSDFRHAYVPGTSLNGAGQVIGLVEFDGYTPGDITDYENYAGLPHVPLHNVLASYSPGSGNDEVCVDIEMSVAMAPGLTGVNVYEGNNNSAVIAEIASPTKGETRPNQISCSWGISGDTSIVQGMQQLAAQGQSFFYALGDNGAFANGVDTGTEQSLLYMTAVGGTRLYMSGAGAAWTNEVVWDDSPGTKFTYFATAGGVLTQVPIPDFQKGISMTLNMGSTQHRNVPDVAAVARDLLGVYTDQPTNAPAIPGSFSGFVGTSLSAPLWAGICALANQEAAQQGKPPLGLLTPALYAIAQSGDYAACFNDITNGSNAWNNTAKGTSTLGLYSAARGFDLCTGWGSPHSTSLLDALVGLSGPVFVDFTYTGPTSGGASDPAGSYDYPFKTMALGVSGVSSGGTIIIKTAASSAETMTISKPMTINANNGPATIGN